MDIAIGNVVGSNFFNIFLILGISSTIAPVELSESSIFDVLVNIVAGILLFIFLFTGKGRKIERWEGAIFVLGYIAYLTYLIFQ